MFHEDTKFHFDYMSSVEFENGHSYEQDATERTYFESCFERDQARDSDFAYLCPITTCLKNTLNDFISVSV